MTAHLDGRTFPDIDGCVHCAAPVRTTTYALGPQVEHYDPAAGFPTVDKGTAWRVCRNGTVATLPKPPAPDECPECLQGKHVNCTGQMIHRETDELIWCRCGCHK